jgi:hypothetical protein
VTFGRAATEQVRGVGGFSGQGVTLDTGRGVAVRAMPSSNNLPHPLTRLAVVLFDAARVLPVERDRWLAAGFEPTEALNYLSAGATLEDALEARAGSLTANDLARHRSRTADSSSAVEVRLEVLDGAHALDQLNRDQTMRSLDPRTPVHLNDWDLVAVDDREGNRWWLPVGVGDDSLTDHGNRLYSFADAYFIWIGLDRYPRALGRHATVGDARAAAAAAAPLAQVSLSWGRRVLGGTGIVWDLHQHDPSMGSGVSLTNDEFDRAVIVGTEHELPLLAPRSHSSVDEALAVIGQTSFVMDGLLIVHLPPAVSGVSPIQLQTLRSLVPTQSLEYHLRGSGTPALMLNGQDYLAVTVEQESKPVLLPVHRDEHGSIDLDTVFDLQLATYLEVDEEQQRSNWYALGLAGELPLLAISRHGEPPEVLGIRGNASRPELVRFWFGRVAGLVDAPDGIARLAHAAANSGGMASGETRRAHPDDPNWRPHDFMTSTTRHGTIDLGLDADERAALATLLTAGEPDVRNG